MSTMESTAVRHVFEKAGLGVAPFRVVGVTHKVGPICVSRSGGVEMWVGAPGQPMGICDFCGQGIAECWLIRSTNGREFTVGCDCVRKTGDGGLRKQAAPYLRELRHQAEAAKITEGESFIIANAERLAAIYVERGTLLERCNWFMRNAGNAGKLRVIREARLALTTEKA